MSRTNQICITCIQRDTCQYYDPNRTICVPVKVSDYVQFAGSLQPTIDWQQVRTNAAVKLTCALSEKMLAAGYSERQIVKQAVWLADVLVNELKKRGQDESED